MKYFQYKGIIKLGSYSAVRQNKGYIMVPVVDGTSENDYDSGKNRFKRFLPMYANALSRSYYLVHSTLAHRILIYHPIEVTKVSSEIEEILY